MSVSFTGKHSYQIIFMLTVLYFICFSQGEYIIEEALGKGSFGTVYQAHLAGQSGTVKSYYSISRFKIENSLKCKMLLANLFVLISVRFKGCYQRGANEKYK